MLSGPTTDAWGVNINKKMLTFDARVLQPPKLIFGKGTQVFTIYISELF